MIRGVEQTVWEKNLLHGGQVEPVFPRGKSGFIKKRKWEDLLRAMLKGNPGYILIWKPGGMEESWKTIFKIIPKEDFTNMQKEGWNKAYSYMKEIELE